VALLLFNFLVLTLLRDADGDLPLQIPRRCRPKTPLTPQVRGFLFLLIAPRRTFTLPIQPNHNAPSKVDTGSHDETRQAKAGAWVLIPAKPEKL